MRKEIKEAIENLQQLDLSKYPYYEILMELNNIGLIGLMEVTFNPGKQIYRARLNEGDEHFISKCQLTYKPQQFNKTCQRASTPMHTMFYGSVLPEELECDELNEVRVVPTFEAIPWLRDQTTSGVKNITYSKWTVTKEIKLVAIIQHGNFYDKSSYTRKLMNDYTKFLNENIAIKDDTEAFMSFMSGEFAKEVESEQDYNYLISASFTEEIVKRGYDGVLYPSVRMGGTGFNVSLTPKVADMKLQLNNVVECKAYKSKDQTVLDNNFEASLYPNQTHYELKKVEEPYFSGELVCLKQLGLESVEQL